MAKASIHFKPVQANSKAHNERLVELDYNYRDLSGNNESWKQDEVETRLASIKKKCKDISGRKMQKNAQPIREAVVNLNAPHTMEDLKRLASDLEREKGIRCFQIHIHRDEGKSREELNYHAHMLFDWQDLKTGKTMKLTKIDMSQIQTLVASSLGMERGELKVNSNRERLEAVEYKCRQEELRLGQLQAEVKALEQKKNRAAKSNRKARERNETAQGQYTRFKRLSTQWASNGIPEYSSSLRSEDKALIRAVELQRRAIEEYLGEQQGLKDQINRDQSSDQYRQYEQLERAIQELESEQAQARRIEARIQRLRADIADAEKK